MLRSSPQEARQFPRRVDGCEPQVCGWAPLLWGPCALSAAESKHGCRLGATQAASIPAESVRSPGVSPSATPSHTDTLSRTRSPVGSGLTALPLRVVSKLAERNFHREDEPGEHDLDAKFGDGHVHLDANLGHAHAIFLEARPDHSVIEDDLDRVEDEVQ